MAIYWGVLVGLVVMVLMVVPGTLLDRWDRWRGVPKGDKPKGFGVPTGLKLWMPIILLYALCGVFAGVISCFFSGDFLP